MRSSPCKVKTVSKKATPNATVAPEFRSELTIAVTPGSNFTADSGGVLVLAVDATASITEIF